MFMLLESSSLCWIIYWSWIYTSYPLVVLSSIDWGIIIYPKTHVQCVWRHTPTTASHVIEVEVTSWMLFYGKWSGERDFSGSDVLRGVQRTKTGFFRGTKIETRMRALFRIFVPRPIGGIPRKKVGRNYKLFKKEQKKTISPFSPYSNVEI